MVLVQQNDGSATSSATYAASGMQHLKTAIQADPEYAHGWHCNLAVAMTDEGVDHDTAQRAADRFMQNAFGVSTLEKD